MPCNEVRHIIDQVINREIPKEALNDLSEHISSCGDCANYLDENLQLQEMVSQCKSVEPNDEFFTRIEAELDHRDISVSIFEILFLNSRARSVAAVLAILFFAFISAVAIYGLDMNSSKSLSDKKYEAMMRKMPDGAVMMRTPDGEEVIFLDPALEADRSGDDIMRELSKAFNKEPNQPNDDYSFASSD